MELIDYIMLPEGLIKSRSEALAVEIVQSLVKQQVTECHLLVAMNGAFVFYAHLLQTLNILVSQTQPRIYFMPQLIKISSYINTGSSGDVKIAQIDEGLAGKHVIIIEDMLDTGRTMVKLRDKLFSMGASKVEACIAFYKKTEKNWEVNY